MLEVSSPKTGEATVLSHNIDTPLGQMLLAATDKGICFLEFADQAHHERHTEKLSKLGSLRNGINSHIKVAEEQLQQYFLKQRQKFEIPLDLWGTDFQVATWQQLLKIPYGQTCSYSEQAQAMNRPQSVRAVANANGANKIAIIIPCHRVIGSSGQLTGYAAGLDRKKWLLDHES